MEWTGTAGFCNEYDIRDYLMEDKDFTKSMMKGMCNITL